MTWFKNHGICKSHVNYSIAYSQPHNNGVLLFTVHDCRWYPQNKLEPAKSPNIESTTVPIINIAPVSYMHL